MEALLASDIEIGHLLRERVIPRAVLFFTGEASDDDDDDEYDDDEDSDAPGVSLNLDFTSPRRRHFILRLTGYGKLEATANVEHFYSIIFKAVRHSLHLLKRLIGSGIKIKPPL